MVVYLSRLVIVERSHVFYAFDPYFKPAAIAERGDLVFFETQDCFGGQIKSEEDTIEKVDFSRVQATLAISFKPRRVVVDCSNCELKVLETPFQLLVEARGV
jgi:hypothetical protein